MGILNHNPIDNGDVEVYTSDYPFESTSDYFPDPETTPIKSIDDGETDHILEWFRSDHDDDILDIDHQILQAWLLVAPSSKLHTVSTM